MEWEAFKEDPEERRYVVQGAPIRITVLLNKVGTARRRTIIRVLRKHQWGYDEDTSDKVAQMLLDRMQKILEGR
jgi:hypothetical protein